MSTQPQARNRMDRVTLRRAGNTLPWKPGRRQLFILPTRAGVILGFTLLAMLLGSLNYNNNLAIAFTFLLIAVFMLSAVLTNRHLADCRLLELEALPVHAGQTLHIRLHWQHTRPGFPPGIQAEGMGIHLSDQQVELSLPTHQRGWLKLPPLKLTSAYPLGLFLAWSWWQYPRDLLIWPRPETTPPPLPTHSADTIHAGQQLPQGDLTELQAWQPGEPLSRVAWKLLARHGQWLSRHPEPEGERRGPVMLRLRDTGLQDPEAAISRLTAWVLEAERLALPYGLDLQQGQPIRPALGEKHLYRCLERLALA